MHNPYYDPEIVCDVLIDDAFELTKLEAAMHTGQITLSKDAITAGRNELWQALSIKIRKFYSVFFWNWNFNNVKAVFN